MKYLGVSVGFVWRLAIWLPTTKATLRGGGDGLGKEVVTDRPPFYVNRGLKMKDSVNELADTAIEEEEDDETVREDPSAGLQKKKKKKKTKKRTKKCTKEDRCKKDGDCLSWHTCIKKCCLPLFTENWVPSTMPSSLKYWEPSTMPSAETPSLGPSAVPSLMPSFDELSDNPSLGPSKAPLPLPSDVPSISGVPSLEPTSAPSGSQSPTNIPNLLPSENPSTSQVPSSEPTTFPSSSVSPSGLPSLSLSESPSTSVVPSLTLTAAPSSSILPSGEPSSSLSESPSTSGSPSLEHTNTPSGSLSPSGAPSASPLESPSSEPTAVPSASLLSPSGTPSSSPSKETELNMSIQPRIRDTVHAVWVNGPSHSRQLSPWWPKFGDGTIQTSAQCDPTNINTRFTGYDTQRGIFCSPASDDLDTKPHLVMYSGKVGLVLDASAASGSIFRQLGTTGQLPEDMTTNAVYKSLASANVVATASLTCSEGGKTIRDETISASVPSGSFVEFGLVRQGHAVTHVTLDNLKWMTQGGDEFRSSDLCQPITPMQDPNHVDGHPGYECDSDYADGGSNPCLNPLYPICKGHAQGAILGSCYQDSVPQDPNFTATCSEDYYVGFLPDTCSTLTYPFCSLGLCSAGAPVLEPGNNNCNQDYGGGSVPCTNPEYPLCIDFVQGVRWGKCWSSGGSTEVCTQDYNGNGPCTDFAFPICKNDKCYRDMDSCTLKAPWFDVTMWGDSLSVQFNWDGTTATAPNCEGSVELRVEMDSGTIVHTGSFSTQQKLSVLLTGNEGSSVLTEETTGASLDDMTITSNGYIVERPEIGDFIVEVPSNIPTCGYTHCGNILATVDVTVTSSNVNEARPVRLTMSRNFETGFPITQSRPGAEITGLSVMVWDRNTQQPNGVPLHVSKNWHSGVGNSIYAGSWWTANVLFYVPPASSLDLTFAIAYEQFKGIPAWSHAQLSIVGYSNKWLWEEAALGTGGENFVMDPLASHTRAVITDVRPKLFDGAWKENVGGGNFLVYFDDSKALQYKKELDAQLLSNGPCLSNATYTSITRDGKIKSNIQISGARTDDLVRVFLHVRHMAVQDVSFGRLAFFQMGADTYNYHAANDAFVFGNQAGVTHTIGRTCSGGTSRDNSKLYDSVNSGDNIYRETLDGAGPWWFSFGPNTDPYLYEFDKDKKMVVGDKGLVVRSYEAQFQGVPVNKPSLSLLCDKIELGPPSGLSTLQAGDYVDMRLEFLVLPRAGLDFRTTHTNSPNSNSLAYLSTLATTWERVQAQADRDVSVTYISVGGSIESHYPIRVCVSRSHNITDMDSLEFTVSGQGLGFVPIVVCNLFSVDIPANYGLWAKKESDVGFTFLSAETDARQANYVRNSETYEVIFNVEILLSGTDSYTQFIFGPNPNFVVV